MRKTIIAVVAMVAAGLAYSYEISVGTYVVNAGKQVVVPVKLDNAAGLSYAGATLTYDPQVLVVTKAEAGSLKSVLSEDFVATDTNGTLSVSIFGGTDANATGGSGDIALVTFAVRDGTAGLYSDICISSVDIGEKTGVKDVTVGNPVTTVNGMVRVMAENADVVRLESAQTVAPDTRLGSLTLKAGDKLQASDAQTPIIVAGAVTAEGAVEVVAPPNGWAGGAYELLKTESSGLVLTLAGAGDDWIVSTSEEDGATVYTATVSVAGEIPVDCEGESLTAGAMNQIRNNAKLVFEGKSDAASLALKAEFEKAKRISVKGPAGMVAICADMGIAPAFTPVDETGTLQLTYAEPKLNITAFDPTTGAVRFKVTPGEGNAIVSEIATGYVHVFGTDNLSEKMRYISSVGFDLTPYLKEETKGEGVLNVTLGTHTFLKIKVENISRKEGDQE